MLPLSCYDFFLVSCFSVVIVFYVYIRSGPVGGFPIFIWIFSGGVDESLADLISASVADMFQKTQFILCAPILNKPL